jgi:D-serine deaminase-like pyridoxal phosphate-dependent protein
VRSPPARVGDPVHAVDTPALVVELGAFERNLRAMADFAAARGLALRPHAKMHKCAAVALRQIELGAAGVCVQKTGEAEALAAAGVRDLYVSNQVVAPAKLARLAALARHVRLAIAVDSALGIERLADATRAAGSTVEVLVEIEVGQGRCGVAPAAAVSLARRVLEHRAEGLRFAGLQAYHGSAQHLPTSAERAAAIGAAVAAVRSARAALATAGIDCPRVTGAGTGSFALEAASGVFDELQPGSYAFLDAAYAAVEPAPGAPRFEQALFVKSGVISRSAGHAVLDAGHKSHAIESGPPTVWGRPDLRCGAVNDEHAILRPADGAEGAAALPALGETVWLVPGHCDPTVNLHDHLVAVRGGLAQGRVEAVWPVDARGAVD